MPTVLVVSVGGSCTPELVAQVRLTTQYGLDTENLNPDSLPDNLRDKYTALRGADGRVKLALVSAFRLLRELNDPVGRLFEEQEKELMNELQKRNFSILAHGLKPLTAQDYSVYARTVISFIQDALKLAGHQPSVPQLPQAELMAF